MTDRKLEIIETASAYVRSKLSGELPEIGIILGSGLGKLADRIGERTVIPYSDIPYFPESTALGHEGNFICGRLGGKCVIAMQGRYHSYEGYPMDLVTLPIRVMIDLGIKAMIVSNAAGSTNRTDLKCGDIMFITDHISMLANPLIGVNIEKFGPRFPDMTHPYDSGFIRKAEDIAATLGIPVRKGVFLAVTGPSYETPAEYGFFRAIGADAVGMSSIPEVCVARQSDIPCLGISVITDVAHEIDDDYVTDAEEIVAVAEIASKRLEKILEQFISRI